ncbi:hypothetical protein OS965_13550 [Streptomyces sp. H27-G5]|uniref:hypothetical protein n=1 Tax=Streptomyces sp. H27-G5 TaxID=2996698 RepID=UPI0022716C70|nr:hypothetical protein [Streptomyces sp. H27-G5]MCY0919198.1 hypothetical protein [Streptomyces sp. H27-G5]
MDRAFPYVLTEPAWAGAHGYGSALERRRRDLAARDPNRGYFASLPAERKALALLAANGPGPDGVRAALPTGGVVRRSDRGWARCMRESGHRYPDPARTRAAALSPAAAMPPGRERALARAEVRCAERSRT